MKKISKEHVIYAMNPQNEAVATVKSGERIQFETSDCFTDQIKSEADGFTSLDWDRINPATGPAYIEKAAPGDILAVHIEKIEIAGRGVAVVGKGMGTLGHILEDTYLRVMDINKEGVVFNEGLTLPINKMIGVIGTSPTTDSISCGIPCAHGGNMDCKEITEGATLYLPVNVPGALLAMGDLHACMGDGEIGISGLEVQGVVTVKVDLIKGKNYPLPLIENNGSLMALASHPDLDEAVVIATKHMAQLLTEITDMTLNEAAMLLSLAGDVKICQVVDPQKTIRVEIKKELLAIKKGHFEG
ncbi:MAG: acetamidase/formamidase family protein [Turicibacter sp.]|nr:acetamidase/formamidase family protein [Turicibacter sp.]